jgi:hypothetical protein
VPPRPQFWGEGHTRWQERGWESPNSDEGTLWYSLHIRTLCLQVSRTESKFVNLLRSPGIDSQPGGPVRHSSSTFQPARQYRLAESIPGLLKRLQIRALQNVCFFRRDPALRDHLPVLALGQTVLPRYGEEGTTSFCRFVEKMCKNLTD